MTASRKCNVEEERKRTRPEKEKSQPEPDFRFLVRGLEHTHVYGVMGPPKHLRYVRNLRKHGILTGTPSSNKP